jgi:hypothetical protein
MTFKSCTSCQKFWVDRLEFILSPDISLFGYQPAFEIPENGLLLFNHIAADCGTTLAIPVAKFTDMYKGTRYINLKQGTISCSGKCLNSKDLTRCEAKCSMAFIREIMQIILHLKSTNCITPANEKITPSDNIG